MSLEKTPEKIPEKIPVIMKLSILIEYIGKVFICASDYAIEAHEDVATYLIPKFLWRGCPAPEVGCHRIVAARHLICNIYWVTGDEI